MGQFSYGQPHCTADHIHTCIGDNWIYIGEVKEGTDHILHGIGIRVDTDGNIKDGHWKDGKQEGRGIAIKEEGYYYIGEFMGGLKHGQGSLYLINGEKMYEGEWEKSNIHGQGTSYKDGNKYTGIWEYNQDGIGEIIYSDGTKYKGHWNGELKRDGQGTLYSADGQVLKQGKWWKDEYEEE